ncbi:hypothetical protein [Actinokineospora fastidiosa]|uniref:Zinc-finger domain-containing protein n=1 Tax=Actinokineospora fastidiosa TaxID=1816 RepID=A0A918LHZ1_9PSEU|nr:hypothetical protein [Actinokineospora fastidiosa]GGS50092.1 hypothetical protein GCM10010171_51570 [Actinokineospora fastidiosa]
MDCETCREAVSARLDGETEPPGADAHLAECAVCREWAAEAVTLTRLLRVREVLPTPDLTTAVLAALPPEIHPAPDENSTESGDLPVASRRPSRVTSFLFRLRPTHRRATPHPATRSTASPDGVESASRSMAGAAGVLSGPVSPDAPEPAGRRRLALGMVAVAQLTLGMAQLLGVTGHPHPGHVDPHATAHLLNESSAWTIALGIGMAWAAFRPAVATGVLITTTGFLAVLSPFAVIDLATGAATVGRVASHAILVLAVGLLISIRRGPHRAGLAPDERVGGPGRTERQHREHVRRAHLRPVSRKSAA